VIRQAGQPDRHQASCSGGDHAKGAHSTAACAPRTVSSPCVPGWTRSLLKRSMANFAAADQAGLVRIIKRKLKKIQYRPHLIDGCLSGTGLKIEPW
jgi:hypothetical protein